MLHQQQAIYNFSEYTMLFLSFMSDILLCVECFLPSPSGKFLFIFQNQLKQNFLHETFPDVCLPDLSVLENIVLIYYYIYHIII